MIFVRTALGVVLVGCLVALAGLGYRLWQVQRQLASRVQALEERQSASTDAEVTAIRACYDRFHQAMLVGDVAGAMDLLTPDGQESIVFEAYQLLAAFAGADPRIVLDSTTTPSKEQLDGILRKHQVDIAALGTPRQLADSTDARADARRVAEAIRDRAGFVADVLGVVQQAGGPIHVRRPVLTDIRVDDDTATAQELTLAVETLTAQPVTFRRVGGRWLLEPSPTRSTWQSHLAEDLFVAAPAPEENAEIEEADEIEPEVP
jgi:hypothetical protein